MVCSTPNSVYHVLHYVYISYRSEFAVAPEQCRDRHERPTQRVSAIRAQPPRRRLSVGRKRASERTEPRRALRSRPLALARSWKRRFPLHLTVSNRQPAEQERGGGYHEETREDARARNSDESIRQTFFVGCLPAIYVHTSFRASPPPIKCCWIGAGAAIASPSFCHPSE